MKPRRAVQASAENVGRSAADRHQQALESQKMFRVGVTPGSSSNAPAGTTNNFPLRARHGNEEPQISQKPLQKYSAVGSS